MRAPPELASKARALSFVATLVNHVFSVGAAAAAAAAAADVDAADVDAADVATVDDGDAVVVVADADVVDAAAPAAFSRPRRHSGGCTAWDS